MRIGYSHVKGSNSWERPGFWVNFYNAESDTGEVQHRRIFYDGPDLNANVLSSNYFAYESRIIELEHENPDDCLSRLYPLWKKRFGDPADDTDSTEEENCEKDDTLYMSGAELEARFHDYDKELSKAAYIRFGSILQERYNLRCPPSTELQIKLRDNAQGMVEDPRELWLDPAWTEFYDKHQKTEKNTRKNSKPITGELGSSYHAWCHNFDQLTEKFDIWMRERGYTED